MVIGSEFNNLGDETPHEQQDHDNADAPFDADEIGTSSEFDASMADHSGKRQINSGALLLVGVVLCAAAGLFAMRTLTQATAANTTSTPEEQSIESFLDVLAGARSGDATTFGRPLGKDEQAVLEVLNESYVSRQVPLDQVHRNPFIIFEKTQKPTDSEPRAAEQPKQDPRELRRIERRTTFEQAAARLRLRSVLMGSDPLANINNEIVRVGDSITTQPEDVRFTVETIKSDHVTLSAEDQQLDVSVKVTVYIERR